MTKIIFVDTETAGLEPHHATIQLAAVVYDQAWNEYATFQHLIKFDEAKADPEALKMNHYDRARWAREAVDERKAIEDFVAFLHPHKSVQLFARASGNPWWAAQLAGHNVQEFDLPRIRAMCDRADRLFLPACPHVLDTLHVALQYFVEREISRPRNMRLTTLCEYFGVHLGDEAHDALADARASAKLYQAIRAAM